MFIDEFGELPFSMKLIIEGEEECGSKTLPLFLGEYKERLNADIGYVCDTSMWDKNTPAITRSLRGLLSEEFEIIGPNRDLHSGEFGGVAWNPIRVISNILANVYDESGAVTIEDFYDGVKKVDEDIIEDWNKLNFNEKEYLSKIGQKTSAGELNRSIFEKTWSRPTFEINGIFGGYTDEGTKTVIPSKASAKITCRLVGNQEPEIIIKNIQTEQVKPGLQQVKPGLQQVKPAFKSNHIECNYCNKSFTRQYGLTCHLKICKNTKCPLGHQRNSAILFNEAKNDMLFGFELVDKEGVWHPANASIKDGSVVVSKSGLNNPKAVRYACHPVAPQGKQWNLYNKFKNKAWLPASPFCSDWSLMAYDPSKNPM